MNISLDSVNRFLNRESYDGEDLFNEVKPLIDLCGGTLSIDDSVLDKPYAKYIAFIGYFWSGKHHASVQGINLVTMYYTDTEGNHYPVNFRVVDKSENKTKNDYFMEMLDELMAWGLKPGMVTGDSWYACAKNLKAIKNYGLGFMFAIKSNRIVSIEKGNWQQVQTLEIAENGERLDCGAASKTSSIDSNMATVEAIDGRKNKGRKRKIKNECDEGR